eukprot:scaffold132704_cov18-Prasinocladus_malaysianus.AAC.1
MCVAGPTCRSKSMSVHLPATLIFSRQVKNCLASLQFACLGLPCRRVVSDHITYLWQVDSDTSAARHQLACPRSPPERRILSYFSKKS